MSKILKYILGGFLLAWIIPGIGTLVSLLLKQDPFIALSIGFGIDAVIAILLIVVVIIKFIFYYFFEA